MAILRKIRKWGGRLWIWLSHLDTATSISMQATTFWSSLLAAVTVVWGYIQNIPGPYLVGLGALVFVSTMTGVYRLSEWRGAVRIVSNIKASEVDKETIRKAVTSPDKIDPMKSIFQENTIHVSDLVPVENNIIEDKKFDKCSIVGPGVLFFDKCTIKFSALPDLRKYYVHLVAGKSYLGVIQF